MFSVNRSITCIPSVIDYMKNTKELQFLKNNKVQKY